MYGTAQPGAPEPTGLVFSARAQRHLQLVTDEPTLMGLPIIASDEPPAFDGSTARLGPGLL